MSKADMPATMVDVRYWLATLGTIDLVLFHSSRAG